MLIYIITILITIVSISVALMQAYKWGWHHKAYMLYRLNLWAIKSTEEEIKSIYNTDSYKNSIGSRHKYLREKILGYSLRKMSQFYDSISPSDIEKCEAGLKEIPNKELKKLENFFFINEEFIDKGEKPIFTDVSHYALKKYIKDGYEPILLCPPKNIIHGIEGKWSFIYLTKEINGYISATQTNLPLSFYSNGTGKSNVIDLINTLLNFRDNDPHIRIIEVDLDTWSKLRDSEYYYDDKLDYFFAEDFSQQIYYEWVDQVRDR